RHAPPDARTRARVAEIERGRGADLLRAAERDLPRDFRRLIQTTILSPADLVTLYRQLGILTTGDLAVALEGHVVAHHGVPEDLAERARRALHATGEDVRLTLGRALDTVEPLLSVLQQMAFVAAASVAWSLRRIEPTVRDLRIVAASDDPGQVWRAVDALPDVSVRYHGEAGLTAVTPGHEVTIKLAKPDDYGSVLLLHTGSREHLALLQDHGRNRTVRLTGDGLTIEGHRAAARTESEAYAAFGLPLIAPELRLGTDEVLDASRERLPRLVERTDIRGDLHMHTDYSDGRDTLESMVATCAALGYEYIAITDHSQSAGASRTLSVTALRRQTEEIDRIQERYPSLRILKGVEVDILPDGRLDFPDSVLEPLDLVLASLHDRAGHSPERLLRRYRTAAEHPLVTILTHPANRLVGRYDGYDLDFDALFEAAIETDTLLEVDGAPSHLDLDGALARDAVSRGVMVSLDSDCHHARLLDRQMRLAIGTARRGRVEPAHAVNTRPLDTLIPLLRRKRRLTA
ncbi:MAG: PHP domain-containing protein, partial [Acidobacteriota bacterium]